MTTRRASQVLDDLVFYGFMTKERSDEDGRIVLYAAHQGDYISLHSTTDSPKPLFEAVIFTPRNIAILRGKGDVE